MSKSGGIAYLLKHGRAPLPAITRTEQPRRGNVGVRGYAEGGLPNANTPLNYGTVPDYVFVPGGMATDERGRPVWKSGRYELRSGAAGAGGAGGAGAGATGSVGVPVAGAGAGGGGGGGSRGEQYKTDYGAVIGDPDASGKDWNELNPDQQAAYSKIADPYGIGQKINDFVSNSLPVRALTGLESLFKGWFGPQQEYTSGSAAAAGRLGALYSPERMGIPAESNVTMMGDADREQLSKDIDGWANIDSGIADATYGGGTYNTGLGGGNGGWNAPTPDQQRSIDGATAERNDNASVDRSGGGGDGGGGDGGEARGGLNFGGKYYPHKMATGGIAALAGGGQPQHPRLLSGGGDGLSDDIPAVIGKNQPARLADGEFVVSADVVSALGGGSTKAGAKKLYTMMDRIRQNAHGTKKQVKKINEKRVLPA